jgi:NADH-quinone oxidoreductase subunit N
MSLPLYVMAASRINDSNSTESGLKYFILGAISSGILLLGISFMYGFTSCIGFDCIYDYYANLNAGSESVVMPVGFLLGLILVMIALAFKISAVPFHMWTPDVYQGAPTFVTMFFASAPKVSALLVLCRILMEPFSELCAQWQQVLLFLAIASMLVGSLGAIMQHNIKRMLAYSSIGHIGFMLCALLTAEEDGLRAMIAYIIIYSSMTIGIFSYLVVLKKKGDELINIADLNGFSKHSLTGAIMIVVFMMSMAGIPPFAGFFAKFYVLSALLASELYVLSAIFMVAAVISAFYYLRVLKAVFFDASSSGAFERYDKGLSIYMVALMVIFNAFYIM